MKTPVPLLLICALSLGIYLNAQAWGHGVSVKEVLSGKRTAKKIKGAKSSSQQPEK